MLLFLRKKQIKEYTIGASSFLAEHYREPVPEKSDVQEKIARHKPEFGFSLVPPSPCIDRYDRTSVSSLMRNAADFSMDTLSKKIDSNLNPTFTDKLSEIIHRKGLRDPEVYRAAQMDRRLFSKIMSDRNFKPARDTVLALIFALRLTLPEATDLLARAGYALSHSCKRDVILEYFILEGAYRLTDINIVLENMGQKIIGR